jgi:stearoyl-CoA desaturase (delta-9 desaturase)
MSTNVLERPTGSQGAAGDPPFSEADPSAPPTPRYRLVLTGIVAAAPPLAAVFVAIRAIGHPIVWGDVAFQLGLAVIFLAAIGHGVTVGYHRLFTHHSFEASRPLKIALAVLGSMSFQGSLLGWVADHRRHHRYADRPGDPHSPLWDTKRAVSGWRGLWHAHLGWCFVEDPTSRADYVPDLLADPDLVFIDRMFVPCCIATLMLPFAIGYAWTGTLTGAAWAFVFAGVIRVGVSHNFTWSINSVCHTFGKRPFATRDASTNVGALALFTMGESWHNNHHAFPRSARHGLDRGQLDTSAALIGLFERLGWATNVQLPDRRQILARRAVS